MPTVLGLGRNKDGLCAAESYEIRIAGVMRGRDQYLVPRLDETGEHQSHRARSALGHQHPLGRDRLTKASLEIPGNRFAKGPEPAGIGVAGVVSGQRLRRRTGCGGRRSKFWFAQLEMGYVDTLALEFRCSFKDFHRQKGLESLGSSGPSGGRGGIGDGHAPRLARRIL